MAQINNIPKYSNPNLKHKEPKNQKEVSDNLRYSDWERRKEKDKYFG